MNPATFNAIKELNYCTEHMTQIGKQYYDVTNSSLFAMWLELNHPNIYYMKELHIDFTRNMPINFETFKFSKIPLLRTLEIKIPYSYMEDLIFHLGKLRYLETLEIDITGSSRKNRICNLSELPCSLRKLTINNEENIDFVVSHSFLKSLYIYTMGNLSVINFDLLKSLTSFTACRSRLFNIICTEQRVFDVFKIDTSGCVRFPFVDEWKNVLVVSPLDDSDIVEVFSKNEDVDADSALRLNCYPNDIYGENKDVISDGVMNAVNNVIWTVFRHYESIIGNIHYTKEALLTDDYFSKHKGIKNLHLYKNVFCMSIQPNVTTLVVPNKYFYGSNIDRDTFLFLFPNIEKVIIYYDCTQIMCLDDFATTAEVLAFQLKKINHPVDIEYFWARWGNLVYLDFFPISKDFENLIDIAKSWKLSNNSYAIYYSDSDTCKENTALALRCFEKLGIDDVTLKVPITGQKQPMLNAISLQSMCNSNYNYHHSGNIIHLTRKPYATLNLCGQSILGGRNTYGQNIDKLDAVRSQIHLQTVFRDFSSIYLRCCAISQPHMVFTGKILKNLELVNCTWTGCPLQLPIIDTLETLVVYNNSSSQSHAIFLNIANQNIVFPNLKKFYIRKYNVWFVNETEFILSSSTCNMVFDICSFHFSTDNSDAASHTKFNKTLSTGVLFSNNIFDSVKVKEYIKLLDETKSTRVAKK